VGVTDGWVADGIIGAVGVLPAVCDTSAGDSEVASSMAYTVPVITNIKVMSTHIMHSSFHFLVYRNKTA
jgi:hypothetical protein